MCKFLKISGLFFALSILVLHSFAQNNRSFELVQADKLLQQSNEEGQTLQTYKGNVEFIKGDIYLYCDSASFNKQEDKLECFGDVKVIKAKSYTFTGDFLKINNEKKKALMKGNVVLSTPRKEIRRKRYKLELK